MINHLKIKLYISLCFIYLLIKSKLPSNYKQIQFKFKNKLNDII